MIEPGAIIAIHRNKRNPFAWLATNLVEPRTEMFHYLLVRDWVPYASDYEFMESNAIGIFPKGIRSGYLEDYANCDCEIYKVDCPEDLAKAAPLELIRWGNAKYDFLFYAKVIGDGLKAFLKMIKERKFRKLRPEDFTWSAGSDVVCTAAVWVGYNAVGVNIVPLGVAPIPAAFQQAIDKGLLQIVYKGPLPHFSTLSLSIKES